LCDDVRLELFPGATHWLPHEEPTRVNRLLADFLSVRTPLRTIAAHGTPRPGG